jgi:hypothetical protein
MSCVAEANASSQKQASERRKKSEPGSVSATQARPAPTTSCSRTIQSRLVPNSSTTGLQSGLITHGR